MPDYSNLPSLTVIVAAYNEQDFIEQKIQNTLSLDYPKDKIEYIFVTDGSSDDTPNIVAKHPEIKLLHSPERKGKIAAMHRTMHEVTTEVVVFTDANTFLNKQQTDTTDFPFQELYCQCPTTAYLYNPALHLPKLKTGIP